MDFEVIKQITDTALNHLKQKDRQLLDIQVNERTISHKLAEYLQQEFSILFVDCEYNRHDGLTKILGVPTNSVGWDDVDSKTVFPDIVVHKRGTDEENLLVIEIKKSNNRYNSFDMKKLRAFTREPYNYKFGLFLEINVDGNSDCFQWFKSGELFDETMG